MLRIIVRTRIQERWGDYSDAASPLTGLSVDCARDMKSGLWRKLLSCYQVLIALETSY